MDKGVFKEVMRAIGIPTVESVILLRSEIENGMEAALQRAEQVAGYPLFVKPRAETRAYKPGMETRTDLPEAERIEKTVFVKAPRSIKYGDVVKVIDAIKGAGANPVGLQVDDLPQ
jgi:carbamoylphosphate synthase large subunit